MDCGAGVERQGGKNYYVFKFVCSRMMPVHLEWVPTPPMETSGLGLMTRLVVGLIQLDISHNSIFRLPLQENVTL